jgi:hypothetical protein
LLAPAPSNGSPSCIWQNFGITLACIPLLAYHLLRHCMVINPGTLGWMVILLLQEVFLSGSWIGRWSLIWLSSISTVQLSGCRTKLIKKEVREALKLENGCFSSFNLIFNPLWLHEQIRNWHVSSPGLSRLFRKLALLLTDWSCLHLLVSILCSMCPS